MTLAKRKHMTALRADLERFAYVGPQRASQWLIDQAVKHTLAIAEIAPGLPAATFPTVDMWLTVRDAYIAGALAVS